MKYYKKQNSLVQNNDTLNCESIVKQSIKFWSFYHFFFAVSEKSLPHHQVSMEPTDFYNYRQQAHSVQDIHLKEKVAGKINYCFWKFKIICI